jgi:hypothetical protein
MQVGISHAMLSVLVTHRAGSADLGGSPSLSLAFPAATELVNLRADG